VLWEQDDVSVSAPALVFGFRHVIAPAGARASKTTSRAQLPHLAGRQPAASRHCVCVVSATALLRCLRADGPDSAIAGPARL
jgi:hypothetical protein